MSLHVQKEQRPCGGWWVALPELMIRTENGEKPFSFMVETLDRARDVAKAALRELPSGAQIINTQGGQETKIKSKRASSLVCDAL